MINTKAIEQANHNFLFHNYILFTHGEATPNILWRQHVFYVVQVMCCSMGIVTIFNECEFAWAPGELYET